MIRGITTDRRQSWWLTIPSVAVRQVPPPLIRCVGSSPFHSIMASRHSSLPYLIISAWRHLLVVISRRRSAATWASTTSEIDVTGWTAPTSFSNTRCGGAAYRSQPPTASAPGPGCYWWCLHRMACLSALPTITSLHWLPIV